MKEEVILYKYARDRWGEGPVKLFEIRAVKQKTRYKLLKDRAMFHYRTFIPLELGHETKESAYTAEYNRLCNQIVTLREESEAHERTLDELRALNPAKA